MLVYGVFDNICRRHGMQLVPEAKTTEGVIRSPYHSWCYSSKGRLISTRQWKEVFEEDIFVVQGLQSGRYAPFFDGGRFNLVMDQPTHCYQDWVALKIITYLG